MATDAARRGEIDRTLAGNFRKQVSRAVDVLEEALKDCGSSLKSVVRLDVYLRDIYNEPRLYEILRERFVESPPVLVVTGGEPGGFAEVKLSAVVAA